MDKIVTELATWQNIRNASSPLIRIKVRQTSKSLNRKIGTIHCYRIQNNETKLSLLIICNIGKDYFMKMIYIRRQQTVNIFINTQSTAIEYICSKQKCRLLSVNGLLRSTLQTTFKTIRTLHNITLNAMKCQSRKTIKWFTRMYPITPIPKRI